MRTWQIIEWDKPMNATPNREVSLDCDRCGMEAWLPLCSSPAVMASKGMAIIFDIGDREEWTMPKRIKCRNCGKEYVR
jgi:ribosomal protein L37E